VRFVLYANAALEATGQQRQILCQQSVLLNGRPAVKMYLRVFLTPGNVDPTGRETDLLSKNNFSMHGFKGKKVLIF
jgi:aminoglycoside phosphotransferase family enzyme